MGFWLVERFAGKLADSTRDRAVLDAAAARQREWAEARLELPDVTLLVMGHTHRPALAEVSPGRWYLNSEPGWTASAMRRRPARRWSSSAFERNHLGTGQSLSEKPHAHFREPLRVVAHRKSMRHPARGHRRCFELRSASASASRSAVSAPPSIRVTEGPMMSRSSGASSG